MTPGINQYGISVPLTLGLVFLDTLLLSLQKEVFPTSRSLMGLTPAPCAPAALVAPVRTKTLF